MKIIAFAGLAGSGKSTAATAAAAALFNAGFHPIIARFAGPLKDASNALGFVKGGEHDDLYRSFCQMAGSLGREGHPEWWVNLMACHLDAIAKEEAESISSTSWHERVVLIDDVRFANEVDMVKAYQGTTVFVSAGRRLDTTQEWRLHTSEMLATQYERGDTPDETFDMTVSNNAPDGEESFKKVVAGLCVNIVTSVEENA